MAKVTTEGKYPRRIGDFVLYPLDDKVIMRAKSGFTSEALKTDPKYVLSRQNASEFGRVSAICKQLRMALKGFLPKKNNLLVVNSLTKKMRAILVYDVHAARGQRTLANAMATTEARQELIGYHFNPSVIGTLDWILEGSRFRLATKTIVVPEGANSVGFSVVALAFDFDTKTHSLCESDKYFYSIVSLPETLVMEVPKLVEEQGVLFTLLVVKFYVEEEGGYSPLEEDSSSIVMLVN